VAAFLTPGVAALADDLAAERAAIRGGGGSTEGLDWRTRIDAALDALLGG
jgi:hypothetical protein